MSEDKDKSILNKIISAPLDYLELQINKAKADLQASKTTPEDDTEFYAKGITEDPTYQINSMGYKQKPHRLMDEHLKQMAMKNTIVSGIIQTRQNQVSKHSKLVKSDQETGFMVKLKPEIEAKMLEEIKAILAEEVDTEVEADQEIQKADELTIDDEGKEAVEAKNNSKDDDEVEEYNWELERKAKEKLDEEIKEAKANLEKFILNCGDLEDRPFDKKKWRFDSYLRAAVRDRLTYDKITTEKVPTLSGDLSYFYPLDASTIKYASPQLKKYKAFPGAQTNVDLLYPEKQLEEMHEQTDAFQLDDDKLENDEYKYVQVVKGRIERAFTESELSMGMMNPTTDIYNNGYSISELELMVSLVTNHLNAEYYKQAYYTQGFSAKGILHLKAPVNRRKLEVIRQQWHHMLKGARNSWQTPIFAGMDEVKWIPLTQTDDTAAFDSWMRYLIKVICAIYQIDPHEIGLGFKDDGGSAGLSGDNTAEKLEQSKDKGLYPLLRFIENYINTEIVDHVDDRFCIVFTGARTESKKEALERQEKEVKFKKTVNEIRAEDGLPPLPGMDNMILDPTFMQWYSMFSKEAKENQQAMMEQGQAGMPGAENTEEPEDTFDQDVDGLFTEEENLEEDINKSVRIEYYKLKK